MKSSFTSTAVGALLLAISASAVAVTGTGSLTQETVRVRGTIERVEGQTLVVKSRDGAEQKLVLAANAPAAV